MFDLSKKQWVVVSAQSFRGHIIAQETRITSILPKPTLRPICSVISEVVVLIPLPVAVIPAEPPGKSNTG